MTTKRTKLSDLTPDHANANKGTERGRYALEASLRQYGAGRSILLDKNGRIVAGMYRGEKRNHAGEATGVATGNQPGEGQSDSDPPASFIPNDAA